MCVHSSSLRVTLLIFKMCLIVVVCFVTLIQAAWGLEAYNVTNLKYHFPSGSGMGLYAALAIPVTDSPDIDLFVAVFYEAFYSLPFNETYYEYPPLIGSRSMSRQRMYDSLETKLDLKGYAGKSCLLRSICEAAAYSVEHSSGIFGDLLHILLTPSTSKDDDGSYSEYVAAEETGSKLQSCVKYNRCQVNFLSLFSFIK